MRFARMKLRNSLRVKVLLAYVAGTVLSIGLIVIASAVVLQTDLLARLDLADAAAELVDEVVFDSEGRPIGFNSDVDDLAWLYEGPQRETAYRILDEHGNVAHASNSGEPFWPIAGEALELKRGVFEFQQEGKTIYGATEPFEHDGRTWYLQFAATARFMDLLHRVAIPLMGAGVVVFSVVLFVAFGLCAFVTLRYTLKPLQEVSESAAAISPRSLHARLEAHAVPAEIAPLVDSFNRALERLEHGYRVQQEFLGNAAHELKTPLALIRAQIELRRDPACPQRDSLLSDVDYMTRQVQQLLLLAEASEAHNYKFSTVRLQDVAQEAVTYLQRMAEAADVQVTVGTADPETAWDADRGALFTLLKNLLENAIQHAPAKTQVNLEIHREAVTVRDFGPGVDQGQLALLFERFWRGPHRRDHGAGLGLAICQEIALAHGWHLAAERGEPGLRFRLSGVKQAARARTSAGGWPHAAGGAAVPRGPA